jgi:hypothetical protein
MTSKAAPKDRRRSGRDRHSGQTRHKQCRRTPVAKPTKEAQEVCNGCSLSLTAIPEYGGVAEGSPKQGSQVLGWGVGGGLMRTQIKVKGSRIHKPGRVKLKYKENRQQTSLAEGEK